MNDPWTWTTGWELTVGVGDMLGRDEQRKKNWDNCNRTTIKYLIKKSSFLIVLSFGQIILFCGDVLGIGRCLVATLACTQWNPIARDSQHTENIQINKVIGENEKRIIYFMEKIKRIFWPTQ